MQLAQHTAGQFADAIQALMPPGVVWAWGTGSFADAEAKLARLAEQAHLIDADDMLVLDGGLANDQPGLGVALITGPAQELARIDAQANPLLIAAVEYHKPKALSWRLVDYRAVADASQTGVTEQVPRAAFVAGSSAGARLWTGSGAAFAVPTHAVDVCRPFVAGSPAGARLWGERARYALMVSYYATVADLAALREALGVYKQAHVVLFFMDITGSGGEVADA